MASSNRLLKSFRTLHLYLGVFTAPALVFFAFTGALQSVPLHEARRGSDYKPPAWLVSLAHLHKKQSLDVPVRRAAHLHKKQSLDVPVRRARPKPVAGAARPTVPARPAPTPSAHNLVPMKTFFVLVALSLLLSTISGVYMGWRCTRNRRRYGATLAAGVMVPLLLLLF
jgi:hypothetical protein